MTAPPDEAVLVADTVLALGVVCRAVNGHPTDWAGTIGSVRVRVESYPDHEGALRWVVSAFVVAAPGRSRTLAIGAGSTFAEAERFAEEDFGRIVAACADLERLRAHQASDRIAASGLSFPCCANPQCSGCWDPKDARR